MGLGSYISTWELREQSQIGVGGCSCSFEVMMSHRLIWDKVIINYAVEKVFSDNCCLSFHRSRISL